MVGVNGIEGVVRGKGLMKDGRPVKEQHVDRCEGGGGGGGEEHAMQRGELARGDIQAIRRPSDGLRWIVDGGGGGGCGGSMRNVRNFRSENVLLLLGGVRNGWPATRLRVLPARTQTSIGRAPPPLSPAKAAGRGRILRFR